MESYPFAFNATLIFFFGIQNQNLFVRKIKYFKPSHIYSQPLKYLWDIYLYFYLFISSSSFFFNFVLWFTPYFFYPLYHSHLVHLDLLSVYHPSSVSLSAFHCLILLALKSITDTLAFGEGGEYRWSCIDQESKTHKCSFMHMCTLSWNIKCSSVIQLSF